MKTRLGRIWVVLAALIFFSTKLAAEVKIGVSLPLTGVAAAYGNDIKRILEYLNERGPRYRLVVEDDRCDSKEAVAIAQKFVTSEAVSMVLGLPCSGTVLSTAPIYERAEKPLIAIGPGAPRLSGLGRWIFRSRPSDEGSACIIGRHVASKHGRVSVVAEETEFAQALADFFVHYSRLPSRDILRRNFLSSEMDFQSLMLKVKADRADALVLFSQGEPTLARLVRTVRELKMELPVYSATFPGSPTFLRLSGAAAEGIEFSVLAPKEIMLTAQGRDLMEDFERERGPMTTLDYGFAVAETAFTAAVKALEQPNNISHYLRSTRFTGSIGDFSFNSLGDLDGMRYVLQRIEGGKPVTLPQSRQLNNCMLTGAETGAGSSR